MPPKNRIVRILESFKMKYFLYKPPQLSWIERSPPKNNINTPPNIQERFKCCAKDSRYGDHYPNGRDTSSAKIRPLPTPISVLQRNTSIIASLLPSTSSDILQKCVLADVVIQMATIEESNTCPDKTVLATVQCPYSVDINQFNSDRDAPAFCGGCPY